MSNSKRPPDTNSSHWDEWYKKYGDKSVSWFQEHSEKSLELIGHAGVTPDNHIIDIGGGASTLIDDLLRKGFKNLAVLDLSSEALNTAKERLGNLASKVSWIEGDITKIELPLNRYDLWHDRAVFHFLTSEEERYAYLMNVKRSLKIGGHIIISTFALDGPTECSGLPVVRYEPTELHGVFGPRFTLLEHTEEFHHTPNGREQHFIYCHCKKE